MTDAQHKKTVKPAAEPNVEKPAEPGIKKPDNSPDVEKPVKVAKMLIGDALEILETAWVSPRAMRSTPAFAERQLRKVLADGSVRNGPSAREGTWERLARVWVCRVLVFGAV